MSILDRAQALAQNGRSGEAVDLVLRAAQAGDGEALFGLANWRLYGLHGPRNIAEAHVLLARAAEGGHVEAARMRATLVGNGTGCRADPRKAAAMLSSIRTIDPYADMQLSFLEEIRARRGARLPVRTISRRPLLKSVRGFLTPAECRYIAALAGPLLRPSMVIDPRTGGRVPNPVRTSSGMSFGPPEEDLVIHEINRRIADISGTQVGWGEPLHVLHYSAGQEYRPHLDALPGVANQRTWTVLIYLNSDYQGGQTRFPEIDVQFAGEEGDALLFRNLDQNGRPDMQTRHAGLPVTGGEKWLATRWIRQRCYHPWTNPDIPGALG